MRELTGVAAMQSVRAAVLREYPEIVHRVEYEPGRLIVTLREGKQIVSKRFGAEWQVTRLWRTGRTDILGYARTVRRTLPIIRGALDEG